MNSQPVHDPSNRRFRLHVDDQDCVLDYLLSGGVMTITHTGVPDAVSGRGLAAKLMTSALGWARSEGLKVHPACSYAATFMRKHAEYSDLLA